VFDDKFGKLNNDCGTCTLNDKCMVKPLIFNATLHVDIMSKTLVFVKSRNMYCCVIVLVL
jgi:hypothetical protein